MTITCFLLSRFVLYEFITNQIMAEDGFSKTMPQLQFKRYGLTSSYKLTEVLRLN